MPRLPAWLSRRFAPTTVAPRPPEPAVPQDVLDQTVHVLLHQARHTIENGGVPELTDLREALQQGGRATATTPDGEPVLCRWVRQPLSLLSFPLAITLPPTLDVLAVLLDAGADPNAPEPHGRVPLQFAETPEVVEALALAGATLGPGEAVCHVWAQEQGREQAARLYDTWAGAHRVYEARQLRASIEEVAPAPVARPRSRL